MNPDQIEKAEQLLGYFDCHADVVVGAHPASEHWTGDVVALLRDMLPDWSAYKVAEEVGPTPTYTGHDYDGPLPADLLPSGYVGAGTTPAPYRVGAALACPHCGGASSLWSDEVASIMYPVRLARAEDGGVDVDYTGDDYAVMDEGTVYVGDIWCRSCGSQLTEDQLTEAESDQ